MSAFTSTNSICPGAPQRVATQSRLNIETATPVVLDFDEIPASRCVTPQRPVKAIEVPNAPLRPIVPAAVDKNANLQVPVAISPLRFESTLENDAPGAPARRRQNTDLDLGDEFAPPAAKRARLEFPDGPLMRYGPSSTDVMYESDDNVSTLITMDELNQMGSARVAKS